MRDRLSCRFFRSNRSERRLLSASFDQGGSAQAGVCKQALITEVSQRDSPIDHRPSPGIFPPSRMHNSRPVPQLDRIGIRYVCWTLSLTPKIHHSPKPTTCINPVVVVGKVNVLRKASGLSGVTTTSTAPKSFTRFSGGTLTPYLFHSGYTLHSYHTLHRPVSL